MLDELLIGGEVQETSKKNVLKAIAAQDLLQEVSSEKVFQYLVLMNFKVFYFNSVSHRLSYESFWLDRFYSG